MNKKFMTLGLAAAVGLAGLVALPVLAANFEKATNYASTVRTANSTDAKGSLISVRKISYSGKVLGVTGNKTVENEDDLKNFVLGAKAKEGKEAFYDANETDDSKDGLTAATAKKTEGAAKTVAETAGNIGADAIEAKKALKIEGASFGDAATYIEDLATKIKAWKKEDRAAAKGLMVNVEVTDAAETFTLGKANLLKLTGAIKDVGLVLSFDFADGDDVKVLDASDIDVILPKEIAKVTFKKKFEKAKVKNELYVGELKKIAGLGAGYVIDENDAMIDKNGFNNAVSSNNTAEQPQTSQEAQNAGNTQGAAPQTTPKTPNTGIAE